MSNFRFCSKIVCSQKQLFDYHMSTGALARLLPPWESARLLSSTSPGVTLDSEVRLSVPLLPGIRKTWLAKHTEVTPPSSFTDIQLSGPFAEWRHQHCFEEVSDEQSELRDEIQYKLPFHPLSSVFASQLVEQKLQGMFRFRHQRTANDLHWLNKLPKTHETVLITGASGLVGRNLKALFETAGYTVLTLSRTVNDNPNTFQWDVPAGTIPVEALEQADAVIHLAGENIAGKRWSKAQKEKIQRSRVEGTKLLVQAMASCSAKPKTFLSASATGFYGNREDEELTEDSTVGDAFVSETAVLWEAEAHKAAQLGIRTVIPRLGIVLTPEGGALQKMLPAFRAGVAGPLGSGSQWMSSIGIDDLVYGLWFLLENNECSGPFNMVLPEPSRNREFTKMLGAILRRPTVIPAPAFALRLALGEMADELLLSSTRVLPSRLVEKGFRFSFPTLESCLRFTLGLTTDEASN